jgi:hypothetical protein
MNSPDVAAIMKRNAGLLFLLTAAFESAFALYMVIPNSTTLPVISYLSIVMSWAWSNFI